MSESCPECRRSMVSIDFKDLESLPEEVQRKFEESDQIFRCLNDECPMCRDGKRITVVYPGGVEFLIPELPCDKRLKNGGFLTGEHKRVS